MRTKKSFLNGFVGVVTYFICSIANFVLRTLFIKVLGETYLGVNGLLTNILSMLSMAELGIGSAIGFSLYKPLANNDKNKIKILMKYYKKAYYVIGSIVFIIGLALMPFISFFIKKGEMVDDLYLIYFIYLITTSYTYFFTYKRTLVASDQNSYKLSIYDTIISLISIFARIIYLLFYKNFIVYLLIQFVFTLIQNLVVNYVIDRNYPYLKDNVKGDLSKKEKDSIFKNIKGLFFYKIGGYLVGGTDNIIMSKIINLSSVALYSNYTLIINTVNSVLSIIFNSATASFGNLISVEKKEKVYDVYKIYNFLGFWLYGFSCIAFIFLINPFITLWIGKKYLLGNYLVLIIVLNFYLQAMLNITDNVKSSAGVYHQDRFIPLLQAFVNLVVSIVLAKTIGLVGVFIGTLASILFVTLWAKPYYLYKYVFDKNFLLYFVDFVKYLVIIVFECLLVFLCTNYIPINNSILLFLYKMFIVVLVPNLFNYLIFRKSVYFKSLISIISFIKEKSIKKISKKK